MMLSDEDRVRELARIVGITIAEDEVAEVASRFGSLMLELDRLKELDLSDVQPVAVFPEEWEPRAGPSRYDLQRRDG